MTKEKYSQLKILDILTWSSGVEGAENKVNWTERGNLKIAHNNTACCGGEWSAWLGDSVAQLVWKPGSKLGNRGEARALL